MLIKKSQLFKSDWVSCWFQIMRDILLEKCPLLYNNLLVSNRVWSILLQMLFNDVEIRLLQMCCMLESAKCIDCVKHVSCKLRKNSSQILILNWSQNTFPYPTKLVWILIVPLGRVIPRRQSNPGPRVLPTCMYQFSSQCFPIAFGC